MSLSGSYIEDEPTEVVRLFVSHDYGSVNSKRVHPPQAFVILLWKSRNAPRWRGWFIQKPRGGALKKCANAPAY